MIQRTLLELVGAGLTSPKEMAELAGVSVSTVYRWMNGQSHPGFDSIRLLIHHLNQPQAQYRLLTALTASTTWTVQPLLNVPASSNTPTQTIQQRLQTIHILLNTCRESLSASPPPSPQIRDIANLLDTLHRETISLQRLLTSSPNPPLNSPQSSPPNAAFISSPHHTSASQSTTLYS